MLLCIHFSCGNPLAPNSKNSNIKEHHKPGYSWPTPDSGSSGSGGISNTGAVDWVSHLGKMAILGPIDNDPNSEVDAVSGSDYCESVSSDASGNVYCAGYTNIGELNDTSGGGDDAFVMKLNSSGTVQWLTQLGTGTRDNTNSRDPNGEVDAVNGNERCYSVSVDSSGNVYCAGYTSSSLNDTNGGGGDAFVMKLNSSGVIQWLTHLGTDTRDNTNSRDPNGEVDAVNWNEYCYSVSVDSSGNVYCAGYTDGGLNDTNGGGNDVFILKLNSSGVVQWLTQLGTETRDNTNGRDPNGEVDAVNADEYCHSVSVDSSANVYCAGYTNGSLNDTNGGSDDAIVMKLNSSGEVQWVTQLGAGTRDNTNLRDPNGQVDAVNSNDYCRSVSVDSSGNVYCAGSTISGLNDTNGGASDALVMKLNSSGVVQWVTQLGTGTRDNTNSRDPNGEVDAVNVSDFCYSVGVDSSGNVYCGGYTVSALNDTSGGGVDVFAMKLNSSGEVQWLTQLGAGTRDNTNSRDPNGEVDGVSGNDYCRSVSVDSSGNVYCAGYTSGGLNDTSGGSNDAFVMKLNSSGVIQWNAHLGAGYYDEPFDVDPNGEVDAVDGDDYCNSVSVDSSGNVFCAGYTSGGLNDTNGGNNDALVMKLNSSGVVQWATQLGTGTRDNTNSRDPNGEVDAVDGDDYCNSVSVDSSGNVYCAGYTNGGLNDTNGGSSDAFVMKLNSSGVVQWVTQLGTGTRDNTNSRDPNGEVDAVNGSDYCNSVSVDSSGNIYCAGYTSGGLNDTNGGGDDAFVMKLNSSGIVQWIAQLGTGTRDNTNLRDPNGHVDAVDGSDYCNSVSVDSSGNIFCAGYTDSALNDTVGGGVDSFVMKLNSSGVVQWVTHVGAGTRDNTNSLDPNGQVDDLGGNEVCKTVGSDSTGNVYCAGYTDSSMNDTFGGADDAFVMKLNSSGAIEWVTHVGTDTRDNINLLDPNGQVDAVDGFDYCVSISVDSSGNVYCAGSTNGGLADTNGGPDDVFVMKLNSSGVVQWITQFGTDTRDNANSLDPNGQVDAVSGSEGCISVSVDSSGSVYCAGYTSGALNDTFGGGSYDAMIMKLN